jgi:RNA polymerase sigma-70 factor (ECF subfamily)
MRGAAAVASGAMRFSRLAPHGRPAVVNGTAGVVALQEGRPISVVGFTVRGGKIVEMDILADPERLQQLDMTFLGDRGP